MQVKNWTDTELKSELALCRYELLIGVDAPKNRRILERVKAEIIRRADRAHRAELDASYSF